LQSNLQISQTLIYVDYKENISLSMGPTETQAGWFNKKNVTVLGILIIYCEKEGLRKKLVRTIISNNLNHDSMFTTLCIQEVCLLI
jgi:hypothetical protein